MIVDAPWYVFNATLHADLGISSTKNATNITLDSEPTKTRSSKQIRKHMTLANAVMNLRVL
jgi:hypothetical protein